MKKNIFNPSTKLIIGVMALAIVFIYSCKKESNMPLSSGTAQEVWETPNTRSETQPQMVGRLHTEYLENYYSQLFAYATAANGIENLTQTHFRGIVDAYITDSIVGSGWSNFKTDTRNRFYGITDVLNPDDAIEANITDIENSSYGSQAFREYLVNIIQTARALEDDQIAGFITTTKYDAEQEFSEEELDIILSALETFESSVNYWTAHESEWISLIDPNGEMNIDNFKKGGIGTADMSGAAAGGTAGALIGGSVTLGTGSVPGWLAGAVVGGVSNSIGEAVGQLWDWLWS